MRSQNTSIPPRTQWVPLYRMVGLWVERTCARPPIRQTAKLALDALLASIAWIVAFRLVRMTFPHPTSVLAWVCVAMVVNLGFQLTRQHYRFMGLDESRSLLLSMLGMVGIAFICFLADSYLHLGGSYLSISLTASLLTSLTWALLRAAVVDYSRHRFSQKHPHRPSIDRRRAPRLGSSPDNDLAQKTIIVGAGQAGVQLCHELRTNPTLKCRVVGFVDDALEKQGLRIEGIRVLGHTRLLPEFIKETLATQVILAMPSAPGSRIRELANDLQKEGIRVKTLPSLQSFLGCKEGWRPELRDIAIEDLLCRQPVNLDLGSIREEIKDSVVLITGAGGSIGSELARQVAGFQPSHLVLLGRGENSLWEVERKLRRQFPEVNLEVELCDIRNPRSLQRVFETWRPRSVFHAAAHKHVPFLEHNLEEAIENNIFGTFNVLQAAKSIGSMRVVNVSTDKAVNPTSVLGITKRIAELIVLQAATEAPAGHRYVSVRFGNVLGSRGSVIPLFRDQIRHGGPITVTHPEMTRYFMTIPEASQLVLQAGMLGQTGKVFVLDMGDPVRIVDLAADMVRLSGLTPGFDIDIRFTGIRPGEKLYEELFTDQEQNRSDIHAKVFEAMQDPKERALLDRALKSLQEALDLPNGERQLAIIHEFLELVPSYRPSPLGLGRHLSGPLLSASTQPQNELSPASITFQQPAMAVPQLQA